MRNNFRKNAAIEELHRKYRKVFRIPENLNHYSEENLKNAERNFIKYCIINGKIEALNLDHPVPH